MLKFFRILYFFVVFSACFSFSKEGASKYIYHTSDRLFYDSKNKLFELSGNVQIFYSDTKIACDIFRYYEDRKYGRAEGNPRMFNPRIFMKAIFVDIFFNEKKAIPTKNVYLRIKNDKKDSKKNWDYFELYTDKLVYNWEKQNIFIPNRLKIVSRDIYLTADQLVYNDKTRILVLKGNVDGRTKEQYIKADKVTYNIDKDIILIEGNIKSVIRVSESSEKTNDVADENLQYLTIREIYEVIISENNKIVDHFIKNVSHIPNIEIYLNYYTMIEIYSQGIEEHLRFSSDKINRSEIIFVPFGSKKMLYTNHLELYQNLLKKNIAWYINREDKFFFENYEESIKYILHDIYFPSVIMFSSPKGMNFAIEEEKKVWVDKLLYSTFNLDFIKGYYFIFGQGLEFWESFRNQGKDKQIFFVIDQNFWRNINSYQRVVFNEYPFKVSLIIDTSYFEDLEYDREQFWKYIFWKSYLYGCSIFVDRELYNIRLPYFRIVNAR